MKLQHLLIFAVGITACNQKPAATTSANPTDQPIVGSWKMLSDKMITKGDTVVMFPDKAHSTEMIKLYTATHFAFFQHDLTKGKAAKPFYSSGAGTYTLKGDNYAEHLAYCDAREWEGHDFKFKLTIHNDTLIQTGIERIDSLNVNREITETYVKMK